MKTRKHILRITAALIAATLFITACGDKGLTDNELGYGDLTEGRVYRINSFADNGHSGLDTYLCDNNGILMTNAQEGDNNLWVVMRGVNKLALKNYTTGNFINVKGVEIAWDADPKVSAFEDDPAFYWVFDENDIGTNITGVDGFLTVHSSIDEVDQKFHVNYRNESTYTQPSWDAAKWHFWEATDLQ